MLTECHLVIFLSLCGK